MKKIYFANKEPIDLVAIAVMGVSVKTKYNPIGYFGTGLKFAIATLLRTGHLVRLYLNGEEYQFIARPETIRGEEFQRVAMVAPGVDEKLGFTTQMGRNWEVWQAYRELACNTMDEDGLITEGEVPEGMGTVFCVAGDALAACHADRASIFISSAPIWVHPDMDIHPGASDVMFYRGVRAHKSPLSLQFTYNLKQGQTLTEDRTLNSEFNISYHWQQAVQDCENEEVLDTILQASQGTYEHRQRFSFDLGRPSDAFMRYVEANLRSAHLNLGAIKLWEKYADVKLAFSEAILEDHEEGLCQQATAMVKRIAPEFARHQFLVLDGMGGDIYGLCRFGHIYIARRTLDRGLRFLASTLYEEWLHKSERLDDCSRTFQDHLLDKLFMLVERMR